MYVTVKRKEITRYKISVLHWIWDTVLSLKTTPKKMSKSTLVMLKILEEWFQHQRF